ncbi:MAG: galactokinase [Planctomycetota bacterium]
MESGIGSSRGGDGTRERPEKWTVEFAQHAIEFGARFGPGQPPRIFFSPGRVNLMGAHLDYNGGPVMPTAIDRGTFIALRARRDRRLRLASTFEPVGLETDLSALRAQRSGRWIDYPLGVVLEVLELARHRGWMQDLFGLEVLYGGNLAVGAGLSSSASICVGTAFALAAAWELPLDRMDIVHAALRAEREFVGVRCGIMDPYAIGLAREDRLLWLDCKDATNEYIPLGDGDLSIAVADTHVRRELAHVAFNERVEQCRRAFEGLRTRQPEATCLRDIRLDTLRIARGEIDPVAAKRAEHVIREVERTFAARQALMTGDSRGFGRHMFSAHESLRDLFEVSVDELDRIVESAALCEGVLGARLTGAGFGGCAVILLETEASSSVRDRVVFDFERRFGRKPSIEIFGSDAGPRELASPLAIRSVDPIR